MAEGARSVTVLYDPGDSVVASGPVQWALQALVEACGRRDVHCRAIPATREAQAVPDTELILIGGPESESVRRALTQANLEPPSAPEALCLQRVISGGRDALAAAGADARGLAYAVLELVDRIEAAADPVAELRRIEPVREEPATPLRSVDRFFVSDVEDKPWFYDQAFWRDYLSMIARQRFNRFTLTLGGGYDFPRHIRDAYFYFPYPFLLDVPGYGVRVRGLSAEERERNLAALRSIGETAVARGLLFQLGIWTQAWEWQESPGANYTIERHTPDDHAAYCRDALQALLSACPTIGGLTLRIHYESGIPEGSHTFWHTVFDGIVRCGRRIEVDLRVKGIDHELIRIALAKRLPLTLSTKYWAEHMGLPYHQTAIRELERHTRSGEHRLANPDRRFTRYGYADLLTEDRAYAFSFRLWPGTQRVLLWGDPAMVAAYARHSRFCGSVGLDLCEPLTFMGRHGSGSPGGRDQYVDESLRPDRWEHEKYWYWYRLWGRLLYNPESDPAAWRRSLRHEFGDAAAACEAALAAASNILPLLTTAHLPSAANNSFWPEVYTNLPIVDANRLHPYGDTPAPKTFGAVSPLDPALFYRIDDYAADRLAGALGGKYTPLKVADWLEELATDAQRSLAQATQRVAAPEAATWRRLAIDVQAQAGLGLFFAHKLRAGAAYALFRQSGDYGALRDALASYRSALASWEEVVSTTRGVYRADLAFGEPPHKRGCWADRTEAIAADLADMEAERQAFLASQADATPALRHVPLRPPAPGMHLNAVPILVTALGWNRVSTVCLHHRTDAGHGFATRRLEPDPAHPPLFGTTLDLSGSGSPILRFEYYLTALDREGTPVARWPEAGACALRLHGPLALPACRHEPPASFRPGDALPLSIEVSAADPAAGAIGVRLHYRRVNQAETFHALTAERSGDRYVAVIPAEYTASPFPLLYFFEIHDPAGRAFMWPGFDERRLNQPYCVVRQSGDYLENAGT